ncbi:MAG TPA: GMP synthase subunit A [Methanoregulaceae archaeon]|nr:GMP synthase subunit A [Methanoregulaceae archaeon]
MLPIYVVNNFGQFNHLILRMLRDLSIDAKMIGNNTPPEEVSGACRGLVLGGGPAIERAGRCRDYLNLGIPVLGICLGLHIIAASFGGEVKPGKFGGYGAVRVEINDHDEILKGYPGSINVWASHADEVRITPPGFIRLASSDICTNEALALPGKHIYGLQWHPEVSHSEHGHLVYENFNNLTLKLSE